MTHKPLISSLILATTLVPNMAVLSAQVDTPVTSIELQTQLDALNQSLIALLTQMIADLQAQITELLAQQTQTATAVVDLGAIVASSTPVSNPVLGASPVPSLIFRAEVSNNPAYWHWYASTPNAVLPAEDNISTVSITSNKEVDYAKTEVYMDGELLNVSVKNPRNHNSQQRFDISPLLASFMKLSETENDTRVGTYQFKIYFTDGTFVTTKSSKVYQYPKKSSWGGESEITMILQ